MINCEKINLRGGVEIPQFGLGVFRSEPGEETSQAVTIALEAGYRHIDTAAMYHNEADVAQGIRASGVKREDIFITTKLSNPLNEQKKAAQGIEESLKLLGTDYIDLYLVHWPASGYMDAWEVMMRYQQQGKLRAIGVSNFQVRHLEALEEAGLAVPACNQIELHPVFQQSDLKSYCEQRGIYIEAWSPIGGRDHLLIEHQAILPIAKKHGKTGAQVILRWHIQMGNIVIPKSVRRERILENADIFDFELDDQDMAGIRAMETGERKYWSPDRYE